jgi:hypothetical protein
MLHQVVATPFIVEQCQYDISFCPKEAGPNFPTGINVDINLWGRTVIQKSEWNIISIKIDLQQKSYSTQIFE